MIQITKRRIPHLYDIVHILKRNEVMEAGVFGSYARGEAGKKSDLDMLVKMKRNKSLLDLAGLEIELEKKIKIRVDLLTYDSINPLLKKQILKEEIKIL